MAEHELDKIVDNDGEVFNLRDSTKRSIAQDTSKGANLVVNGSGRMSNNYNFSTCTYLPTICNNGSAGSFGFSDSSINDEFISVDFNKRIEFSVDIKNLVAQPSSCIHRIAVHQYDIDKLDILDTMRMYGTGTLTELTQDLNPGDTVVHLANLSNSKWLSTVSYQRGFIFWNYTNSYGYTYPPETYSRNYYPVNNTHSLWDVGNVDVSSGTITLNSAWSGPAIPAGTKVSRRNGGNTYVYPAVLYTGDTNWHSISGYMKGINPAGEGETASNVFSQGTAFIKVSMHPTDLSNTDATTGKRATFTNFYVYEAPSASRLDGVVPVANGGTGQTSLANVTVGKATTATDYNTSTGTIKSALDGKVNVANVNLDGLSTTILAQVQSLASSKIHYKRFYTSSDGGSGNISDKPSGTTAAGFMLEAYCNRYNSSTDWRYVVLCYVQSYRPKIAWITSSSTSISWQDLNTDTKVKATAKTDDVNYKILATASASPTSGYATEAVYDADITLNPSTKTIAANISGNAATATTATNYVSGGGIENALASKQDSLGYGTSGQYLKSNGNNNAPSWDDSSNMTAGGITNASYNSGYTGPESNWSRCIKIDLKSARGVASIRCLLLQATDSNAAGFVDIIIKSKEDNSWDGVSYVARSELSNSNLGKVGYYQTGTTVYLGISVGAFGSLAIPMLMGKTGNIDITFGDFTSIMTSEPSSTMLPSFINTHAPINTAVGSTSTPVHVASNGRVQECDPSQMSVGTTQNVATQGAASNSISRHVWFSDSTTETKRAHDDNLKYTPATNTISANISGSATSIGGKKIVVGSLGTDSNTIYFLTGA